KAAANREIGWTISATDIIDRILTPKLLGRNSCTFSQSSELGPHDRRMDSCVEGPLGKAAVYSVSTTINGVRRHG
ncbi:uncharacterized protein METZ01_LOCUS229219, partial [marine metagenome]